MLGAESALCLAMGSTSSQLSSREVSLEGGEEGSGGEQGPPLGGGSRLLSSGGGRGQVGRVAGGSGRPPAMPPLSSPELSVGALLEDEEV